MDFYDCHNNDELPLEKSNLCWMNEWKVFFLQFHLSLEKARIHLSQYIQGITKYVFCLRRSRIRKGRAREKTWTRDGQFSSRVRFNSTKLFWISRVMKIDHPEFTFFPNCEPWVNTASEQMRFLYEETIFKCWWGNNLFPGEIIYVPALTLHSTGNDQVNKLQKSLPGHT